MYKRIVKQILDLLAAFIAILALSPLFVLLIILLSIVNEGKPFFTQKRPGYKSKPFYLIKFKSMNEKRDANGELLPSHQRITKIGNFIRKTSLDEIPQLINVLKGEISLVGPRPLRMEYLPLYSREQNRRHDVKPGITGWAQVNGRNSITWEEKFNFDVWYVDNISIKLDLKILYLTVINVLRRSGVNKNDNVTMEPFKGAKLNG
jgi:undecaprenyl phosphate N,N'-diacetylbacillosamine 1-phosphate transferase